MDRYTKAVIASAVSAFLILGIYFHFRSDSVPDEATPAAAVVPSAAPLLDKPISPKVVPAKKPAITANAKWLAGWWSEDGFCEGDAGQTFLANGDWGVWGIDGVWKLEGARLTVTEKTRVMDTESGEPEPIDPPLVTIGTISNISENSFDYKIEGSLSRMVRCPEGE